MKKVITVVLAVFVTAASFAQSGSYGNGNGHGGWSGRNDNNYRNERYDNREAERERDRLIFNINREFDSKIRSVRNNWFMRSSEKARRIHALEIERDYQIRKVNDKFYRNGRGPGREW